jgi:hypothetical protein
MSMRTPSFSTPPSLAAQIAKLPEMPMAASVGWAKAQRCPPITLE